MTETPRSLLTDVTEMTFLVFKLLSRIFLLLFVVWGFNTQVKNDSDVEREENLPTETLVCRSYKMPGSFSQKEMSLSQ